MCLEIVYLYFDLFCVFVKYQLDMLMMLMKINVFDWLKDIFYLILVQCESNMIIFEVI